MINTNNKKQIVFITNPFGFGPAGKLYPIIKEFHKRYKHEIFYFTGSLTSQIIKEKYIKIIKIDERSAENIAKELKKLKNPYIISSLNRFALTAAKSLHIPCAFIDGLSWLWNSIPENYLIADTYFALNFLGVDEKIKAFPQIIKTPYILDNEELGNKRHKRKNFTLFHIGGFENPLHNSTDESYLRLLISFFNHIKTTDPITVAGGKNAMVYLSKQVKSKNIQFRTFNKKNFNLQILNCKHLITTPGLTTTLEAFLSQTPVSFLLPSNLSQYKILSLLVNHCLSDSYINWDGFYNIKKKLMGLGEKDALILLDKKAKELSNNKVKLELYNSQMLKLFNDIPDTKKKYKFIKEIGTDGSNYITNKLEKLWNLKNVKQN